ncbi:MAG TPA: Tat pathway signal protein, partial [Verrucomicrobiae bacterium]|nr:Tat pathway signal protein [Verrucomicrobiae bacterium]
MKIRNSWFRFALVGLLAVSVLPLFAQQNSAEVNLAVVATPTSSFASGDTDLSALNDGFTPRSSRDSRRGSYGNWPRTGTEWVQYEWSRPISTKKVEVYWWIDG